MTLFSDYILRNNTCTELARFAASDDRPSLYTAFKIALLLIAGFPSRVAS